MKKSNRNDFFFPYYMRITYIFSILSVILIISCIGRYKTIDSQSVAIKREHSFENGKNLTFNICGQCHYNDAIKKFIGKKTEELPRFIGKVYSSNLTHSASHGVMAKYSDAELAYLLKTGIARDGRYVPWMIRPNLSEEDLNDIIIYLRSNDAPLAKADTVAGKTKIKFFGKIGLRISGKPFKYTITKKPSEADVSNYGKYLVDNLACNHCHSERVLGLNYLVPEKSQGYMQGGMEFKVHGKLIYASNLTPDSLTGIGRYNLPQFENALWQGIKRTGEKIHAPMQKFPHLTEEQVRAIYIYLKTLPSENHLVKNH
ncbi:MAG: hypothetical protein HY063_04500 [Bacteroidetes bacterium]|nr:hypothetical protein [Bacteroidota bacterium]